MQQNPTLGHKKHCAIQHLRHLQTRLLMIFITNTPPLNLLEINLKGPENGTLDLHRMQDPHLRMQYATYSCLILFVKFKAGSVHTLMPNLRRELILSKANITWKHTSWLHMFLNKQARMQSVMVAFRIFKSYFWRMIWIFFLYSRIAVHT